MTGQEKTVPIPVVSGVAAKITSEQMSGMLKMLREGNVRGALESAAFKEIKACHAPVVRAEQMQKEDYQSIPTVLDNQPMLHNAIPEDQVQIKTTVSVSLASEHYVRQIAELPIRPTAPVRILAPTGFGKTTRVPLLLNEKLAGPVLVIEPNALMAQKAVGYVCSQGNHADLYGRDTTDAGVVYIPVNRFLAALVINKRAFDRFCAVILDEAHHHGAAYLAAKSYLHVRTERWFVCYMTAADGDHHANYQSVGPGVERVDMPHVEYGCLDIPRDHPMHPKNISSRVMLVTPDIVHHEAYVSYYKQYGVHATKLDMDDSTATVNTVFQQLDGLAGNPAILIVDPSYCEGITVPVDIVMDFCLRKTFMFDVAMTYFKSVLRPAMRHEMIQAAGRLGRLDIGTYMFMKRENPDIGDVDKHLDYIAVLWLKLLDIKPTHEFDDIVEFFAPLTKIKALVLLALGVHPIFAANYVDTTGCYRNYSEVMNVIAGLDLPVSVKVLRPERRQWVMTTKELQSGFVSYYSPYNFDAYGTECLVRYLGVVHYLYDVDVKRLGAPTPTLTSVSSTDSETEEIEELRPISEIGSSVQNWPVPFYGVMKSIRGDDNRAAGARFCQHCGCTVGDTLANTHLLGVGKFHWAQSHHQCQRVAAPGLEGLASFSRVVADGAEFTFFVHNQSYKGKKPIPDFGRFDLRVGCDPRYPEEDQCYCWLLRDPEKLGPVDKLPKYMTGRQLRKICNLRDEDYNWDVCGYYIIHELFEPSVIIHVRPPWHVCDDDCIAFKVYDVLELGAQFIGPKARQIVRDRFVDYL